MAFPIRQIVIAGAVVWAVAIVFSRLRKDRKHSETLLDKGLEDTFPASDATATQDFAIPVNRL